MTRLIASALIFVSLGLSACGFQPVYAERTGVSASLSNIAVQTSEGRAGYQLGLALKDRLGSWSGDAEYTLKAVVDMSRIRQSVTVADIATRYEVEMDVDYVLIERETGETVKTGKASGEASFDVPADPYATVRAEQDSELRAARDAAQQITSDLALWFQRKNAKDQ